MLFYRWLIGDMGTPGDYSYSPMHLYTIIVVAALCLAAIIAARVLRKSPQGCRRLLVGIAWFQLGFEILWRLIYVLIKGDSMLCWWPIYPCNLGGILLPLLALWDKPTGKRMFYLFGFVGGVLTFAIPDGIFSTSVMVFPIVKSILQHTGLLLIPIVEYVSGSFRPKLQDVPWMALGCGIHMVNCEGIDRLLGFTGDYMFLRGTLPFVIPGVPQWITILCFGTVVLSLLAFLSDVKASLHLRKSK